ncbi:hypothetical protein AMECASPLE_020706 [Ameca splendens]|uniref:Uncharacterized protein n=1 Tax=Ameca splendens TaxID=208324 RepID=A0ABV0ZDY0_9TELE
MKKSNGVDHLLSYQMLLCNIPSCPKEFPAKNFLLNNACVNGSCGPVSPTHSYWLSFYYDYLYVLSFILQTGNWLRAHLVRCVSLLDEASKGATTAIHFSLSLTEYPWISASVLFFWVHTVSPQTPSWSWQMAGH